MVDDISHEGLRVRLREEGVTFQRLKTWKALTDPRYAAKRARVEHLPQCRAYAFVSRFEFRLAVALRFAATAPSQQRAPYVSPEQ